jgi:signal peptidase I
MHETPADKKESPLWLRLMIGRNPRRTFIRALILAAVTFGTFHYIFLPVRITGLSMEPTYHDGTVNLVNRLSYLRNPPRRGDIVAIKTTGLHVMYLKRIVGLPSETVAISNGTVLINGEPLDEPYLHDPQPWNEPACQLKSNGYFLVGDNRTMPQEQHEHGIQERPAIVGKILW